MDIAKYTTEIFKIKTDAEFERLALQAFVHQKKNCPVYKEYLQLIGKDNIRPKHATEIPFQIGRASCRERVYVLV